jgi:hypothetical protein
MGDHRLYFNNWGDNLLLSPMSLSGRKRSVPDLAPANSVTGSNSVGDDPERPP